MSKSEKPDFIALAERFQGLSKGQKAEIRRATEPEALLLLPSYYQLIRRAEFKANAQGCRVVWFLPYVEHQDKTEPLGRVMADKNVNERRLFQVVRSDYPNDLIHLQRILQQIKSSQNWESFGSLLYYWGPSKGGSKKSKQILMKDYYLKPVKNENSKGENHE